MRKSLIGAAVGITVLAAALTGCSSSGSTDGGSDDAASGDKPYIALVSKGFQHQFWQAVKAGAEQAAEEFDVDITFEGPDTEADVDQQIQQLQTALDKEPDAIGLAALDSQAVDPLLQQAQDAGIPVIAFDSGVDSDIPVTTATTDNLAAAGEAAKQMAELIGNEGKIAMVVHDQTSITGIERRDGFVDWMDENAPNIEIVDIQYGGGDQLESTDLAKAIIAANPDLKGIYGSNEGSAIGVVNAVQELGLEGKLTVVGFDSGQAQIDAITNGVMAGAITQNPVGIGYETVKAAVAAINGEKLPKVIDTGFFWYDKSNIDSDEIQAVIYE
ncbi:ABC transporter substrate-binding protein [Compostimonas suwonensis]|uniref:Ribose transport system substrate-binding protein n=1 Tax=Compostimonas suwonensis TaxID=1048394 RepID=A0A2M9BTY4_9MICO|nr:ABC transporter substrate-binding protein [Compostimonas suwonensis]PJJ61405.1 ribose transport system substrate-binding protein [Compostimonas suwonensis]